MDEIAFRLINFLLRTGMYGDFSESPILQPDQKTKRLWAQDYVVNTKKLYSWD